MTAEVIGQPDERMMFHTVRDALARSGYTAAASTLNTRWRDHRPQDRVYLFNFWKSK